MSMLRNRFFLAIVALSSGALAHQSVAGTPLLTIDQQFVLEHCRPPGKVIDLGCGTGRLAITLAQHGYRPVGVDLSLEMLDEQGKPVNVQSIKRLHLEASDTTEAIAPGSIPSVNRKPITNASSATSVDESCASSAMPWPLRTRDERKFSGLR